MADEQASRRAEQALDSLRTFALGFPGAWHDTPWGDSVVKVGKKIFVFLGEPEHAGVSVKLPDSADHALSFTGAAPTGYGLGRAGWVTIPIAGIGAADLEVVHDFVEESYRAVAPKRLVTELDAREPDREQSAG